MAHPKSNMLELLLSGLIPAKDEFFLSFFVVFVLNPFSFIRTAEGKSKFNGKYVADSTVPNEAQMDLVVSSEYGDMFLFPIKIVC